MQQQQQQQQQEQQQQQSASKRMESLMEKTGNWGRFQWQLVLTMKWGMMPIAWSMMQMAFAGMVPDWWCLPSAGHSDSNTSLSSSSSSSSGRAYHGNWSRDNVTFQACEIPESDGVSCRGYLVFDESVTTVINEWSLVCDQSYVKRLMTSLQMGGVMFGALIGGQCSDTIGRRVTVYVTILCHTITSLVAAFSVTWQMFVVMRVLIGVTLGLYLVSSFSYPMEFVGPRHRQFTAFIPAWSMGVSIFALVAWQFPNWKYLHIASALLGVPYLLTWCVGFLPESARWLATKGRLQEAEQVVEHVARVNGRPKPHDTLQTLQHVALEEEKAGQGRRYTYLDVYRGCRMALTSLTLHFIWFVSSFSYYGISFGVSALSGNLYLNIFLMSVVEIPTNLSTVFLANRLGRRWTCLLFFLLCAVFSFGILVVHTTVGEEDQGTIITVFAMGTKLSVASAWLAASVVTSEQYPTVIRNLGYGASNTVSRIGGALAPLLLNMDTDQDVVNGYIIIGALMTASGLSCLLLRETKGQSLQDSIVVVDKGKVEAARVKVKDGVRGEGQQPPSAEVSVWTINGESMKKGFEHPAE